ncbi:MAG TPA: PilZ domain-containing protein [Polyangiaceae bacterium]|nr:PilZ domain-containing protein [Polyangiaceae bacterium]
MKNRPASAPPESVPWVPRRSAGGARTESTERITLRAASFEATGWTLNVSRGGFRAIVECQLEKDLEYEVWIGDASSPRRACLVWCQEQSDGLIAGFKYTDVEPSSPHNPAPSGE